MYRPVAAFSPIVAMLASLICAAQPTTKPPEDAWPLYLQAAQRIQEGYRAKIMCPAASNLEYAGYPPFPPEWHSKETASYAFNAPARALARDARHCKVARWPTPAPGEKLNFSYLNQLRSLANEISDAAVYEHLQGDDAAAIESLRDELHLADLLDTDSAPAIVVSLVAVGVRAIAAHRLNVITSAVSIADDATDAKRLQVRDAKELIRQLFDTSDPIARSRDLIKHEEDLLKREGGPAMEAASRERILFTLQRSQMESRLAALSLACHLFYHDKSRWPASVDELTAYLPAKPLDAFGAMGYVLVKAGLPNGSERPLVYSRCTSKDGLFYRVDEPQYGYYQGDGTNLPTKQQKEGGQFRDVARWAPTGEKVSPTTQPIR